MSILISLPESTAGSVELWPSDVVAMGYDDILELLVDVGAQAEAYYQIAVS
jgi:hypothetical protein